ncbi:MAG: DUF721 domain-containing protein [Treponema sp.]|jgi:hypothetical protein|nr:DUF721 domain-containing protein [Treponema sp.]
MKKAGDLLSSFFDKEILKTARGYSVLFSSWKDVINEQFGPKMGDRITGHSRIKELEKFILQIETDHPGWIQILQTRQNQLLETVRRRFPSLNIRGLSFRLSRGGEIPGPENEAAEMEIRDQAPQNPAAPGPVVEKVPAEIESGDRYEKIRDPDFKNVLKRLEQSIAQNNRQLSQRRKGHEKKT